MELVLQTALEPREELTWTTADKPFMFVAACRALMQAGMRNPRVTATSRLASMVLAQVSSTCAP
jgi:hypothetical protein